MALSTCNVNLVDLYPGQGIIKSKNIEGFIMSLKKRWLFALVLTSSLLSIEKVALAARPDSSIVIGPTFSSHSFDSATAAALGSNPSTGVGFSFGSFFGLDFSDDIGAEFGVLYVKRTTVGFISTANYNSTILNVPLLLRLSPISGLRGLKIQVGPYFGFLPSASLTLGSSTLASSANTDSVDIGAMGGLSYFAPITENLLFRISALYSYGFADLNSAGPEIKTRGLDTYVGIVMLR
jgi:hypothetical protein